MAYVVVGVSSTTGTVHRLEKAKRSGKFVLVSPDVASSERKFERNYTLVNDMDEAVRYIEEGYHARMANLENSDPPDIILNKNIKVFQIRT
jgi:hypothetical protein